MITTLPCGCFFEGGVFHASCPEHQDLEVVVLDTLPDELPIPPTIIRPVIIEPLYGDIRFVRPRTHTTSPRQGRHLR